MERKFRILFWEGYFICFGKDISKITKVIKNKIVNTLAYKTWLQALLVFTKCLDKSKTAYPNSLLVSKVRARFWFITLYSGTS